MADLSAAIAAAREAFSTHRSNGMSHMAAESLGDLLAALDAARGQAVAWVDEFGNAYPLAAYSGKGDWQDDHKRHWRRAYAAPPAALAVPADPLSQEALLRRIAELQAPPAAAVSAENADTLASIRDYLDRCGYKHWVAAFDSALQAPPAAAVPASKGDAERSKAWRSVCDTLDRVCPDWMDANGKTGTELAVAAIERLAAQQPAALAVPEVLCTTCGQPTMHMGSTCYGCGQAAMLAAAERKGGGQ